MTLPNTYSRSFWTSMKGLLSGGCYFNQYLKHLMYITNDDNQNYPFCILKLFVEKFGQQTELFIKLWVPV